MPTIGNNSGLIPAVFGVLFILGFIYNLAVSWMERRGYDEGYTALLVVGGVLITLAGIAVIDWRSALLALGAFSCSGLCMVIGSWWRHVQARRRAQELLRK